MNPFVGIVSPSPAAKAPPSESLASVRAAAVAEGKAEGAKRERARCAAILRSPEAKGRTDTARALALETNLTAEEAVAVLAKTPTADANAPGVVAFADFRTPRPTGAPQPPWTGMAGGAPAPVASDFERGRAMFAAIGGKFADERGA